MNVETLQPPQNTTPRPRSLLVIAVWALASTFAAGFLLAAQPVVGLSMEIGSLVMLAPAIGAAICWLTMRKHMPTFAKPAPQRDFLVAVGLAVVAAVFYFAVFSIVRGELPQVPAKVAGMPVGVMLLAQTIGALAEEIGYRGVFYHALAVKLPRFAAAVVVGVLFGIWHVQHFALPFAEHTGFILGAVALTVTMAYVMTGSFWQRMVVATIIHLGANLAMAFTGGAVSIGMFGLVCVAGCAVVAPIGAAIQRHGTTT